jgi:hypothetical protein
MTVGMVKGRGSGRDQSGRDTGTNPTQEHRFSAAARSYAYQVSKMRLFERLADARRTVMINAGKPALAQRYRSVAT